jgi:hypothetical protein
MPIHRLGDVMAAFGSAGCPSALSPTQNLLDRSRQMLSSSMEEEKAVWSP